MSRYYSPYPHGRNFRASRHAHHRGWDFQKSDQSNWNRYYDEPHGTNGQFFGRGRGTESQGGRGFGGHSGYSRAVTGCDEDDAMEGWGIVDEVQNKEYHCKCCSLKSHRRARKEEDTEMLEQDRTRDNPRGEYTNCRHSSYSRRNSAIRYRRKPHHHHRSGHQNVNRNNRGHGQWDVIQSVAYPPISRQRRYIHNEGFYRPRGYNRHGRDKFQKSQFQLRRNRNMEKQVYWQQLQYNLHSRAYQAHGEGLDLKSDTAVAMSLDDIIYEVAPF